MALPFKNHGFVKNVPTDFSLQPIRLLLCFNTTLLYLLISLGTSIKLVPQNVSGISNYPKPLLMENHKKEQVELSHSFAHLGTS